MSNKDVVIAFLNMEKAKVNNLNSTGTRLFSYNTCIAQYINEDTILLNTTKYSVTTSKHLTILKRNIKDKYQVAVSPRTFVRGTQDLNNVI